MQDRSLHNDVYGLIVEAIHCGDLKPGDRITEGELAGRLGISRSPVREAFARLIHDGLVVQKPRRGTFVAKLERDDIEDIQEVRALVEGHAARRAAAKITLSDMAALRELVAIMVEAAMGTDWIQVVRLNARFHETVVRLTGNKALLRIWSVLDPLAWLIPTTVPVGHQHNPQDLFDRHTALIDALASGDPQRAEEAFRAHISPNARQIPTE
ncbi:MAG TPA: GntR family transcriptional regulator [Thermomicrobiales bacterium]